MSFITLLTPLTALPIIIGLFIGVWSCLTVIAGSYGFDLTIVVTWISIETKLGLGAPLIIFVMTAFALARGYKMRETPETEGDNIKKTFGPLSLLEKACLAAVGLSLVTFPYSLVLPFPELWVLTVSVLIWFVWKRKLKSILV